MATITKGGTSFSDFGTSVFMAASSPLYLTAIPAKNRVAFRFELGDLSYHRIDSARLSFKIFDYLELNNNQYTINWGTATHPELSWNTSFPVPGTSNTYNFTAGVFDYTIYNIPAVGVDGFIVALSMSTPTGRIRLSHANLSVTYSTLTPNKPDNLSPNETNRHPKAKTVFSWRFNPQTGAAVTDTLLKSELRYRKNGGAWVSINNIELVSEYTLPADTFATDDIVEWQVRTESAHNDWSDWSDTANFKLAVYPPDKPTYLSPSGVNIHPKSIVKMSWQFNPQYLSSEMDEVKGSEVRYRVNGGTWKTYSIPGLEYQIAANTFAVGNNVEWQVRTEGTNNGWSDWSDIVKFYIRLTPPKKPTGLSPDKTEKHPKADIPLSWQFNPDYMATVSDELKNSELRYQVNGGAWVVKSSTTLGYAIPKNTFAENDVVVWQVRTEGTNNGWSEWSETATFTLKLSPPKKPTYLVPNNINKHPRSAIQLTWQFNPDYTATVSDELKTSELRYQVNNGTWTIMVTAGAAHIFPKDTFKVNDTVKWQVRTEGTNNGWSEWSDIANFGLEVYPAKKPSNLEPDNIKKHPKTDIALIWQFNPQILVSEADELKSSEVRYRVNGGTWKTYSVGGLRYDIPKNTLVANDVVEWQVRTEGTNNGWSEWSDIAKFSLEVYPPLKPTNLSPNNVNRHPYVDINMSWLFNPQPVEESILDSLARSELRYRINGAAWRTAISVNGAEYTMSKNTFAINDVVEWQVRTEGTFNGWSDWSDIAKFKLELTPPREPTLIYPVGISVRAANGVALEWRYNSPYDAYPMRFDIQYRIDSGTWITKRTDTANGKPAPVTVLTEPVSLQSEVEWQVRAYGQVGDAGPWSNVAMFFVIGVPKTPVIVQATNSSRPIFTFSVQNIMSWKLEVMQNNAVIYESGEQAFTGDFIHLANRLFPNGNYLVRMKVTNEYGYTSEWGYLAFTINVTPPEALKLDVVDNHAYYIRLRFNNMGKTIYIYRSKGGQNKFLRIAMTTTSEYSDYTVQPGQRYEYYVRVVNINYGYADSEVKSGITQFPDTTIAEYDKPGIMLKLINALNKEPKKDMTITKEQTFTHFIGRDMPIVQVGEHSAKNISFEFFCTEREFKELERLRRSGKILLLRDTAMGSVYGVIDGQIRATYEMNGYSVSFVFSQVYYDEEVEYI